MYIVYRVYTVYIYIYAPQVQMSTSGIFIQYIG